MAADRRNPTVAHLKDQSFGKGRGVNPQKSVLHMPIQDYYTSMTIFQHPGWFIIYSSIYGHTLAYLDLNQLRISGPCACMGLLPVCRRLLPNSSGDQLVGYQLNIQHIHPPQHVFQREAQKPLGTAEYVIPMQPPSRPWQECQVPEPTAYIHTTSLFFVLFLLCGCDIL